MSRIPRRTPRMPVKKPPAGYLLRSPEVKSPGQGRNSYARGNKSAIRKAPGPRTKAYAPYTPAVNSATGTGSDAKEEHRFNPSGSQ